MKIPIGNVTETLGFSFRGMLANRIVAIIDHAEARPCVTLRIAMRVPDATESKPTDDQHMVRMTLDMHLAQAEHMDREAWIAWVDSGIRMVWQHELDEAVIVDGKHLRDPHPPNPAELLYRMSLKDGFKGETL